MSTYFVSFTNLGWCNLRKQKIQSEIQLQETWYHSWPLTGDHLGYSNYQCYSRIRFWKWRLIIPGWYLQVTNQIRVYSLLHESGQFQTGWKYLKEEIYLELMRESLSFTPAILNEKHFSFFQTVKTNSIILHLLIRTGPLKYYLFFLDPFARKI